MPNKKAPSLDKKELEIYKTALQTLRTKIAGDLEHLEKDSLKTNQRDAAGDLSGYSFHMADMASDNFEREFALGLASNEQQALNMIDGALRRIADGNFGVCETCSKPIPKKRLKVVPYAALCIACQELEEKEQRRR